MIHLSIIPRAVYLGIQNYGAEEINRNTVANFLYRFLTDGEERVFAIADAGTYRIQNRLRNGYIYSLTIDGATVLDAVEIGYGREEENHSSCSECSEEDITFTPAVSGIPGKKTLKNFLLTALEAAGTVLYVYGGGWNWQDTGASPQCCSLGVSRGWIRFFRSHDASYTYKEQDGDEAKRDPAHSYYPYGGYNAFYYAGLDCSGFLGWALYNTLETENGKEGYVGSATGFAGRLTEKGFGKWSRIPAPGDIMSIRGHVWISLGCCPDGSTVILHSTPSMSRTGQPGGGVQISAVGPDKSCEAYRLARAYMAKYYPVWFSRYDAVLKSPENYFPAETESTGLFSWNTESGILSDPEGIQKMNAAEALSLLFNGAVRDH